MRIGIFGGSFDPVHCEHVRAAEAVIGALRLDKLYVVPSFLAPHKAGANADGGARLNMCRLAFRGTERAEVSDCELEQGGTSYTYLTCRRFRERFPDAELYFLVGADMLEDFFTWKNPDEILSTVTLAAFGRGDDAVGRLHEQFRKRFGKDFCEIDFRGEKVSSTRLRVRLAFGQDPKELPEEVLAYIKTNGLYVFPCVPQALALEKKERQEHSLRVAYMAAERARSLKISEEKAILAAALHDCGKYLPPDSPYLNGFQPPCDVPPPVLHQYTGAYVAQHIFGVTDPEVLDAICYHTSGKVNMSVLGKLIFLSDLLEEGRDFAGIDDLREAFWRDLDECFVESLKMQREYLKESGKPVYPLTEKAYEWAAAHLS